MHTKTLLTEALNQIPGMPPDMIKRAIDGYYHDFESELPFPVLQLLNDLCELHDLPTTGPKAKTKLMMLMNRVRNGDFDASKEEADAWIRSDEGQKTIKKVIEGQ